MIEDLFGAFSIAVLERRADGRFDPIGQMPSWFGEAGKRVDLADRYPLLEVAFAEWEDAWTGHSDVWTEPHEGGELYLEATAATLDGHRYLALRSLPQELFTYQQLAHDFELAKQKVERLSRELDVKRREAERATQAKSDFLATMSHEIRTPLNAIIGMADVLSTTALTAEQKKCVDIFQRNGVGLLTLINDILDLSKVEAGRVELEVTDFDLRDVVSRAMEVVAGRAAAKGLTLRESIAPGVPIYLSGDPNRLRQIIINLLGNSIKFTEKGGLEVRVECDPDDPRPGRLRFCISDTGIGIPRDKLGVIFESFSQVDSSTTRKYGGTGLGLTISKQFVELMDGRIWVESEPGVGSNFFFTAGFGVQADQTAREPRPTASVGDPGANGAAQTAPAQTDPAKLTGLRILLADDSDDNRYLILSYLRGAPVSIDVAENGEIAARMFRENDYDVVLMDVEMPVMDGYDATRAIRAFEKERGLAAKTILALTAHAFADMAAKSAEAGFTGLLTKPIRRATLLSALAEYAKPGAAPINVIEVEEGMEDVVPGYVAKRKAELPLYQAAIERNDFEVIRQMAHKMKGTGAGYGFPFLTESGKLMEDAATAKDGAGLRGCLSELEKYLQSVQLKYSKVNRTGGD